MDKTKEQILDELLKAYESMEQKDFNAFLQEQAQALWLTKEQLAFLEEGNRVIDEINAKALELVEAKKNGLNRQEWMQQEFDTALDDRTEEEKVQVLEIINEAMDKRLQDLTTEMEDENGNE